MAKKSNKKTELITLDFTEEEYKNIQKAAEILNMNVEDYCIHVLDEIFKDKTVEEIVENFKNIEKENEQGIS